MTTNHDNRRHALFETAIGWIAIGWSDKGVTRLQLPERDRDGTQRRLMANDRGSVETPPPPAIEELIRTLTEYASGQPADFSGVALDLAGIEPFRLAIYEAARKLGFGETATYGELAANAGHAGMARETGQALGSNPVAIIIPCHRILAAGGKIGGFSAHGGATAKQRLLVMEGVRLGPPPSPQASFGF